MITVRVVRGELIQHIEVKDFTAPAASHELPSQITREYPEEVPTNQIRSCPERTHGPVPC